MRFEILRIDSIPQSCKSFCYDSQRTEGGFQGVPDTYELDVSLEFKVEKKMVAVVIQGVPAAKYGDMEKVAKKAVEHTGRAETGHHFSI